ncbi:MFS transporter [Priestia endophytica]|uniref:Predicted arabinose efflux permease, MFS family n=1 Tax=Priestia endophytica DSM 13796 TaxID=1121089 RepID=A0A1I5ZBW2_9BACI|nr:MFS transporter [Priestia endophytica]KYG30004.1 arabinose ABC transporter permease [Priestia endophytica]RAS73109.1 MFS transporter [Priestia endophytica]SFQ53617.1 Predicted arabinose efflux permease, MFS family [Priestia endophytica DSM 13796]
MAKRNNVLIFILTIGVFGIINTEMGVIGLLPSLADHYNVSVTQAGLLVSLFALGIAISGPVLPLLFSGINRKKVMLLVLGVFVFGNIISIFTTNFTIALIARIIPAFFHPIYCSLAFTVAADSVSKEEAPKAVSKIFIGVSAGMVAGVPIASFIDSAVSYEMAMAFFAIVNSIVFIATLIFVPSMPVEERLSYGTQLSVLKKPMIWLSIVTVILLNSAVFGVYSYFAEYLKTVTNMSPNTISLTLFLFGGASIIGNIVTGKLLTHSPIKSVGAFPLVLGAVYIILFFTGQFTVPMEMITLIWGILAGGIMANINQYLIASSAPEAPDFANGLFISACNVGTTIGTAAGGLFISEMGIQYIVLVGLLSLLLGLPCIMLRNYMYNPTNNPTKQLSR